MYLKYIFWSCMCFILEHFKVHECDFFQNHFKSVKPAGYPHLHNFEAGRIWPKVRVWPPPASPSPTLWWHPGTWEFGFIRPVGWENSLPYSKGAITPYTCLWPILLLTLFQRRICVWRRKMRQPALVPAPWEMTGQIFTSLLRNGGGRGSLPLPSVWQRWG